MQIMLFVSGCRQTLPYFNVQGPHPGLDYCCEEYDSAYASIKSKLHSIHHREWCLKNKPIIVHQCKCNEWPVAIH